MQYRILHQDAFPIVECKLQCGETLNAESDAMIAMSTSLDIKGTVNGGFFGGLARKFLTGESFFMQKITATRGDGDVLLGHSYPGGIADIKLDGSFGLKVQKNGFLAATANVQVNTAVQNLAQGFLSREGFFILNIHGNGIVFVSCYGAVHPITLASGEEYVIDNGHLVAWPDYMNYKMERATNGWISSVTSGECLVCRFRGPGTIYIQTRNPTLLKQDFRN